MRSPTILVAGGVNLDTTLLVRTLPTEGQSVSATGSYRAIGGKGLNQALAARRAGAEVAMVGATGNDAPGREIRSFLVSEGVNIEYLIEIEAAHTGQAIIVLDSQANNLIVGELGANLLLEPGLVQGIWNAWNNWKDVRFVAANGEGPDMIVQRLFDQARSRSIQSLWNPSPMPEDPESLLERTDVLIANRSEAEELGGRGGGLRNLMRRLLETGPSEIIVTLGEEGCVIANKEEITSLSARSVDAVDPTAAGDTFLGYFLASRANGASTTEAARVASFAASICVQTKGAARSIPHRDLLDHSEACTTRAT